MIRAKFGATGWLGGVRERARALLVRAKNEHSSPREVGFSVAIGVFSACTPFLGLHMWIALALATLFRLNRLWAFLGSRVSVVPVYLWISFCEIELGHRLLAGEWVHMTAREALARGKELSADWALGTALVGVALATLAGFSAYACALRWSARTHVLEKGPTASGDPVRLRRPDGPRPPSSECPPSAPPGSSS